MRGPVASEQRSGQLQRLARAGLIADDACLATFAYPELQEADHRHLKLFVDWLTPTPGDAEGGLLERTRALHDTETIILNEVSALAEHETTGNRPVSSPNALLDPIDRMLDRKASDEDVRLVRGFAEIVSRVTLMLSQQLENEKDNRDWTPTPLAFSRMP